jgi:hypothetical protein
VRRVAFGWRFPGGGLVTFELEAQPLRRARGLRYACPMAGTAISHATAMDLLRGSQSFRDTLIAVLAEAPFDAYFWETPPVCAATLGRGFEFVVIDAPTLARLTPDEAAFSEHFGRVGPGHPVAFPNLGADAVLVAPAPSSASSAYAHLGRFVREAPAVEAHALLAEVGAQVRRRLGSRRLWLSTSGLGVAWLHVRLDSTPKYYQHAPYAYARSA